MSTLPPLVCDTPPPIEEDEDFPADDFTEFEATDFDETPQTAVTLDEKIPIELNLNVSPPSLESPESALDSPIKAEVFLDEDPFTIDDEGDDDDDQEVVAVERTKEEPPKLFDFPVREEPDGSEGEDTKPELSTSFDEFCDFRTVHTDLTKKESLSEKWTEPPQWEPNFEVNFEATFPDDLTEAPSVLVDNVITQSQIQHDEEKDDDDDDFGDFTEAPTTFQQQQKEPQEETYSQLPPVDLEKFVEILGLMFPKEESQSEEGSEMTERVEGRILMKDVENSEALTYKYANSRSSTTLMDSIGIDSKNVLYGMKWNSSMPRFAANLSFDPIQPQTIANRSAASANATESGKQPAVNIPSEVPAAQFDWTSAGLVNPLDGPAEIPITHQTEDSTSIISPEENPATLNAPTAVTYIEDDFVFATEQPSYSMRTITLPETHIFTPEKGTNTISQSVDRDSIVVSSSSPPSQSKGIVIKEYRDIEYSLDKCLKPESVLSATAAPPTVSTVVIEDELVDSCRNISSNQQRLDPKKDIFPIFGTSPTESPAPKQTTADDVEFSDFHAAPPPIEPLKPKPINPLPLSPEHLLNSTRTWSGTSVDDDEMLRIEAFARSKNHPAPPARNDEDEWSDFVCVPPTKSTSTADDDWSDFVFTTPASSQPIMTATKSWNSPLPPTYTAGNYAPWSTGQSTTPAIRQSTVVPELNFVASKPNVIKHQFMRK